MWVQHIHHLLRIAHNRNGHASGELQAYLLWYALYLDAQACLGGNGAGDFARAFAEDEITLPDWRETTYPAGTMALQGSYPNDESTAFAAVYRFSNGVCKFNARLATLARRMRTETSTQEHHGFDHHLLAARQTAVSQLHNELHDFWNREYPSFLSRTSAHAGAHLPMLARIAFEFVGNFPVDGHRAVHLADT